jgi:hypothetical protein
MHDLTLASQAAYMRLQKGRGRHRYSPRHTTRNEGGEALRRLLLLVGLTMLGALLFASVALAQDYSSATATATWPHRAAVFLEPEVRGVRCRLTPRTLFLLCPGPNPGPNGQGQPRGKTRPPGIMRKWGKSS